MALRLKDQMPLEETEGVAKALAPGPPLQDPGRPAHSSLRLASQPSKVPHGDATLAGKRTHPFRVSLTERTPALSFEQAHTATPDVYPSQAQPPDSKPCPLNPLLASMAAAAARQADQPLDWVLKRGTVSRQS